MCNFPHAIFDFVGAAKKTQRAYFPNGNQPLFFDIKKVLSDSNNWKIVTYRTQSHEAADHKKQRNEIKKT